MNHDAALACRERAYRKCREGNLAEARRYAEKARRLDPTIDIPDFLSNTEEESNVRRRRSPSRENPAPPEHNRSRDKSEDKHFTKSDVEAVRKIMACKDLYKLLGVSKDASVDEIKRAYKNLARKYHPDKNKAPGATEAFKKIGSAFSVLVEPTKRQRYDQFGTVDDARPSVTRHQHNGDGFYTFDTNGGFDAEFINMFFNGGFPFSQNVRFQRQGQTRRNRESEPQNNYFAYIQILPLLILFGLSFFSNLFVKDPVFSIQRTTKYPIERLTEAHSLPYYVKESFAQDYDGSLRQLEGQVLEQHVYVLRERCFRERGQKESMLYRARYTRDNNAYEHAKQMKTPSCDRVIQLYG